MGRPLPGYFRVHGGEFRGDHADYNSVKRRRTWFCKRVVQNRGVLSWRAMLRMSRVASAFITPSASTSADFRTAAALHPTVCVGPRTTREDTINDHSTMCYPQVRFCESRVEPERG